MKKKIGILIDSASTFEKDFIEENNIWVAPLSLTDSDDKVYMDDNKDIPHSNLVLRLENGENFKTSMTPLGHLMDICDKMFEKYENIIFVPISKGLSGQWQSAQIAKKEFSKLHVVNSKSAAYANEVVVKNILKDIEEEKTVDQIVTNADRLYDKIFTIFSVEETSGMKSGGRITNAILKVIDVLKLKPIIRLDVKNEYGGVTRNYQKGIKKMVDAALKWCKNIDKKIKSLCVYFSGYAKEKLEYIKDYLSYVFSIDKKNIDVRWVPNTVLVHTKLGAYGFSVLLS